MKDEPQSDTQVQSAAVPAASSGTNWKRRIIMIVIGVVLLALLVLLSVSFLPRWWSQRIANLSGGTFSKGITTGLLIGFVFTLLALVVIRQAFRKSWKWPVKIGVLVLGLLLASPNLLTLGIVVGNGTAAHSGERVLDTEAPGFRGATLAGVLIAAAVFILGQFLLASRRRNKRKVKDLKARVASDELALKLAAEAPAPEQALPQPDPNVHNQPPQVFDQQGNPNQQQAYPNQQGFPNQGYPNQGYPNQQGNPSQPPGQ